MKIDPTMSMKTKARMTICHAILPAVYQKMQELQVKFTIKRMFFDKKAENRAFAMLDGDKRSADPLQGQGGPLPALSPARAVRGPHVLPVGVRGRFAWRRIGDGWREMTRTKKESRWAGRGLGDCGRGRELGGIREVAAPGTGLFNHPVTR